jgi:Chaperone of endosialidase
MLLGALIVLLFGVRFFLSTRPRVACASPAILPSAAWMALASQEKTIGIILPATRGGADSVAARLLPAFRRALLRAPRLVASAKTATHSLDQTGYVGIGTTNPAAPLHIYVASGATEEQQSGSSVCTHTPSTSSETIACSSDRRLKTDIVDSESVLGWLERLRVRDFTVKETGQRKTGVIAQEVQNISPDMVHMESNGFYAVDEPNPWKLVKAIQELFAAIQDLEHLFEPDHEALAQLKAENAKLEAANDREAAAIDRLRREFEAYRAKHP